MLKKKKKSELGGESLWGNTVAEICISACGLRILKCWERYIVQDMLKILLFYEDTCFSLIPKDYLGKCLGKFYLIILVDKNLNGIFCLLKDKDILFFYCS